MIECRMLVHIGGNWELLWRGRKERMVGGSMYERVNVAKFLGRGRKIRRGGNIAVVGEERDEDRG